MLWCEATSRERNSPGVDVALSVTIFANFAEEPSAHSTSTAVSRAISCSGSRTTHDDEVALQLVLIDRAEGRGYLAKQRNSAGTYWAAIHRVIAGQCSFKVRAPMNSPMWPPGTVFCMMRSFGVPRYLAASRTCSGVVMSSSAPASK